MQKLQRLWTAHHPQYIISKDSENLQKSLCARHKAKKSILDFPLIIRPSGSTTLKTGMLLSWKSLHGLRNTFRNHFLWTQFNPRMQVKALTCKEEAICKYDKETLLSFWAKAHWKCTVRKWKTVLWPHKMKFEILFLKTQILHPPD